MKANWNAICSLNIYILYAVYVKCVFASAKVKYICFGRENTASLWRWAVNFAMLCYIIISTKMAVIWPASGTWILYFLLSDIIALIFLNVIVGRKYEASRAVMTRTPLFGESRL